MGNSNDKYIKALEDRIESKIRKGVSLKEIKRLFNLDENFDLFNIVFNPNKWNIFHLATWYGNFEVIKDLMREKGFRRELLDLPDINGESPVVIACVIDEVQIFKFFIEVGKCSLVSKNINKQSEIHLNEVIVTHDAVNCFNYLYPDLTVEDEVLNDLYDMAKHKNSENIIKVFEQDIIEVDFDFGVFAENEPCSLDL